MFSPFISTQLSMKFIQLINVKIQQVNTYVLDKFYSQNCWHFNIYEQDKFHAHEEVL